MTFWPEGKRCQGPKLKEKYCECWIILFSLRSMLNSHQIICHVWSWNIVQVEICMSFGRSSLVGIFLNKQQGKKLTFIAQIALFLFRNIIYN